MASMIVLHSESYDAPYNLALEEYFLQYLSGKIKYILFLWQNDNAVIIGRNQNAKNECSFEAMKRHGARLVRRNTGGGAVFHDKGNLNFSIICPKEDYDIKRSAGIIKRAVLLSGIEAEYSGRNDLLVNGSKFSGNAFLTKDAVGLHHGTILVDTDIEIMAEVLKAPKEKMEPKGINSVKSRVTNLSAICPSVTVEEISRNIVREFVEEYEHDTFQFISGNQILSVVENEKLKTIADDWNMGENFNYTHIKKRSFSWGICEVRILETEGIIRRNCIYTDSLFPKEIEKIEKKLNGLSREFLRQKNTIEKLCREINGESSVLKDIFTLINDMH